MNKLRRVVVINYGMGNLLSVQRGFEARGAAVEISADPEVIARADRLVLPGVGAFAAGMQELQSRTLIDPVREFVASGRPLLGICLGMQMLMAQSEEFGLHAGLNLIPGRVIKIPDCDGDGHEVRKIPHIGWSALHYPSGRSDWRGTLLANTNEGEYFYFVHSFMAASDDQRDLLAECDYNGVAIAAVVSRQNVMGCQFHPEKSGEAGLGLLDTFLEL